MAGEPETEADAIRLQRQARKERRAKQRIASLDRAAKMHAARLGPPTPEPVFRNLRRFHVGCSGWYYWHWHGIFYPESIPRSDWFKHYAENFDTVELNAPFYSWPTIATVKTWIRQAANSPDFVYTVKVSDVITHVKQFVDTEELVLDFGYIADLLGPRFGCFLFQLPPSFSYTPERLSAIVGQLDPKRR
ncbi:MAG TPA: DUF72 domain-containing protein, partial [Fimbriimonadaceae bacterium]|nr:DUF72 domain-containing protein [Fimbriimonadaceae bacterium]